MVELTPVAQTGDLTFPRVELGMTNYRNNVDEGAILRFTGDGMCVTMLVKQPGVYYNDHGRRVPEAVAAAAGFDIERFAKIRAREEAKQQFAAQMDAEYATGVEQRVVWEAGEYRVVECALDLYNVEFFVDGEGTVLNARAPLSLEVAKRRFEELTGTQVSMPAEPSQPGSADVEKEVLHKAK